jgi:hypothetical protein
MGVFLAATHDIPFAASCAATFAAVFGSGVSLAVRETAETRVLILVGVAAGLLFGLLGRWLIGFLGADGGIVTGAAGGGIALIAAVVVALRAPAAKPLYVRNPIFTDFVSNDVRTAAVSGALAALITGFMLRFMPALDAQWYEILPAALAVGVSAGFGMVADAWRRHAAMILCCRGRLSFRLNSLLELSHTAELLRRVGIAYEFRHLELRDHFATLA